MNKKKVMEKEVDFIINQVNNGASVNDVCYMMGITQSTFYSLRKKYCTARKLSPATKIQLERENDALRELIRELERDKKLLIRELTLHRPAS